MDSFNKDFHSVVDRNINLLTQFKVKFSKLDQEIEMLYSMKEDTESKLRGLERPGRRRKRQVDNWLRSVEQTKEKKQDIMNQINEIFTYESIDEIIGEVIKDVEDYQSEGPSSGRGNMLEGEVTVSRKQSILGIGGFDNSSFHLTDSPINFNIGNIQMIHISQGNDADGEGKA